METKNNRLVPFQATHPGEILKEELAERGITQKAFAAQTGMSATHLNELIKGKRDINAAIAFRLEQALGISFQTWINLQSGYDYDRLKVQERENKKEAAAKKKLSRLGFEHCRTISL